jgi:hypothetical protein
VIKFRALVLLLILISFLASPATEANFIQCLGGDCDGTGGDDFINGTALVEIVDSMDGNDLIFSGGEFDTINSGNDDDTIFSGAASDTILSGNGNDIIFGGPDGFNSIQFADGGNDDDTFFVFAGETSNCYQIYGEAGFDVVHLIGFGPFVDEFPFGAENFDQGAAVIVEDPIAGGLIFIFVTDTEPGTTELIRGLPTPEAVITDKDAVQQIRNERCVDDR